MRRVVAAGLRAPSGDNCQPWEFRWDGARLRILFSPERAESLYDVANTASWISLGAVLTNIQLVSLALGWHAQVGLFPAGTPTAEPRPGRDAGRIRPPTGSPVVADVRFVGTHARPDPLVNAIDARCVHRGPYRPEAMPAALRAELASASTPYPGVRLTWIEERARLARVAALAAANDRFLFENAELHDGLYRWLRWTAAERDRTRDGMPIETLELNAVDRVGFRILGSSRLARGFTAAGLTRMLPRRAAAIYRRSAALALLSVDGESPEEFVQGGQALQRIWLTATARDVAFQPITGITFLLLRLRLRDGEGLSRPHREALHGLRSELEAFFPELAERSPVMLFRVGAAGPPSGRALRRLAEDVLRIDGPL